MIELMEIVFPLYAAARGVMPLWDRDDVRDTFHDEFVALDVAIKKFEEVMRSE